jgi:hypothetical protein
LFNTPFSMPPAEHSDSVEDSRRYAQFGRGATMLKKMGWNPGDSIGLTNAGVSALITPERKLDRACIGAHGATAPAQQQHPLGSMDWSAVVSGQADMPHDLIFWKWRTSPDALRPFSASNQSKGGFCSSLLANPNAPCCAHCGKPVELRKMQAHHKKCLRNSKSPQ